MPRKSGLLVAALAALLVAGEAAADGGKVPPQCRKSDRCTLTDGVDGKANQGEGKVRIGLDTVEAPAATIR
jgi:hypothetical protein